MLSCKVLGRLISMGKRNFRKGKNDKKFGRRLDSQDRTQTWTETKKENEKWETYYKALQIVPPEEWDEFKRKCQESLPLTFRITGTRSHANEIKENFIENHVSKLKDVEFEGIPLTPTIIPYYPNELGWQLDVSKSVIRKNEQFAKTQRFLVLETEVGNISRQEAVSMVPPLLMDIEPHNSVLDMCAAPGSKTAQLIEGLHREDDKKLPVGFLIANDSDYKRSHMLVHQIKRLNSPNVLVVNHDAQLFPKIKLQGATEFFKFDRILCDVPCSGDGTMRKNVNVWKDFTVGNGLGLHSLQVNILNRSLQLLKKGGKMVYSTCSLSPVENEAVIAAALRKWGGQVRVLNCDGQLPALLRRPGLNNWKVFGKDMQIREKGAEDVPGTVFPPTEEEQGKFDLQNCMRIYPHLQNTGGFFVAVLEKIDPENKRDSEEGNEDILKRRKVEASNGSQVIPAATPDGGQKVKLPRDANEEPFIFLNPDNSELNKCWSFYGISQLFPSDSTLVRNATGIPLRSIYYIAPILKEILTSPEQKLKVVHGGVKLFVSQRNDSGICPWRIQGESLQTVRKFLSLKRQLSCNLELLKVLFQEAFPKIDHVKEMSSDSEFCRRFDEMQEGCLFLSVRRDGDNLEDLYLPLWKGRHNVNLMVNKKESQELLYRVFGIETSSKDVGKEQTYQKKVDKEKKQRLSEADSSSSISQQPAGEPAEKPAHQEEQ